MNNTSVNPLRLIMILSLVPLTGCVIEGSNIENMMGGAMVGDMSVGQPPQPEGGTGGIIFPLGGQPTGGEFVPTGGDDQCTPGQPIAEAECTVCGRDAGYIMPKNDPRCDPVDCSELNSFYTEVAEDGAQTCMQNKATNVEGTCRVLGYCHTTTNTACLMEESIPRFTVYPGCGSIQGCDSTNNPIIMQSQAGDVCHTFGTCEALGGPCSISSACAGFNDAAGGDQQIYCDSTETSCKVDVNTSFIDNLDEINCFTYCTSANKTCDRAWQSEGGCTTGEAIPCTEARGRVICECK